MTRKIIRWACALICLTPAIAMLLILSSDMDEISPAQAFGVRAIAFFVLACTIGAAALCAKHGLFPEINDPDEED